MAFVDILFWISIFCGGLLVILMLLSIAGGLDLDLDADLDGGDGDTGFGTVKSMLTVLSVGSWMTKIIIASGMNLTVALIGGITSGLIVMWIFIWMFKFFMKQQKEVNWVLEDAIGQVARVYLKIPKEGSGIIQVELAGSKRELKARSTGGREFATGSEVLVVSMDEDSVFSVTDIN